MMPGAFRACVAAKREYHAAFVFVENPNRAEQGSVVQSAKRKLVSQGGPTEERNPFVL